MTNHDRRNAKNAADLLDAVLPRLKHLRIFWIDGDLRRGETRLEHRDPACLVGTGECLQRFRNLLALIGLQNLIRRQDDRSHHAVLEHPARRLLAGHGIADHIALCGNWRKPAITARHDQSADMKHVLFADFADAALLAVFVLLGDLIIAVVPVIALNIDAKRIERVQRYQPIAIFLLFGEEVAIKAEAEGSHAPEIACTVVQVRQIVQQFVQRILAVDVNAIALVDIAGQRFHGIRNQVHTRPNSV